MDENKNLAKTYDPKQVEDRLYSEWMENDYFHAEPDAGKAPYTIVIPPPNITGQLHMGHALDNTLQDILVRWRRMQGYSTLWLPGTDHASIATEARIVDTMAKEGLTKEALGREKFLERAWEWKKVYGGRIVEQLKKLGSSCDWKRERFTMDEGLSAAVQEVFLRLHSKGLIYRGERMTNWCPKCNTSISDIEVEFEEKGGHLWHIRYPVKDMPGRYITVATTRPETMLGDTAVAVHPEDERYADIVGKTLVLPLTNREIPVVADTYVEKDFGSGAVKITPAHDPNDFELGKRHNLPEIRVIGNLGKMNDNAGDYAGLDRYDARKKIVADLEAAGLLERIQDHTHNVGTCQRCHSVIEPLISMQWYVRMKPLAEPAIDVVRDGTVKFVPDRFSKTYFNWMENIQDWCISRQLWWGHRIPAWYCEKCGELHVAAEAPACCTRCGHGAFRQDEDTLDTWFSSALWPFSTLGWPEETNELKYYYPTSVLVTGYDIIFFWVARMIFSGMEQMGQAPFSTVFIHGLVRDAQGRKMSKSLGNGIDPLEIMDQFGTDALRFALVSGISPGNDLRFQTEKVEAARNFANKIWNATRFVLMNFDDSMDFSKVDAARFSAADKWIMSRANTVVRDVTENLERFELGLALGKIYDFVWEEFCDWYIELVKPRLYDRDNASRLEAQYVLNRVLQKAMQMLHPFMPFITEEIYQHLVESDKSVMISKWPEYDASWDFTADEAAMARVMDIIRAVRNIRSEMNVPMSRKAGMILVARDEAIAATLTESRLYFEKMAYASDIRVQLSRDGVADDAVSSILDGVEVFLPLEDLIDISKEVERLEKEKANLEKELARVKGMLSNEGFLARAPQKVVDDEKAKLDKYAVMHTKVEERIAALKAKL